MTEPLRAAIYCRISRDDEGTEGAGLGVQRQAKDCADLADRMGWTTVGTFTDNDISAMGKKARPRYLDLLEAIRSGQVDVVVAWHTDRLHRSPLELEGYIDACEPREVPTHTVKAGLLDLTTASGRMIARILGAVARHQVEHMIEQIHRQKRQQREAGLKNPGPRPYGYRWAGKGLLAIDQDEAAHIRYCYAAVLAGQTLYSIARALTAAGAVTPQGSPWSPRTLRQMLLRASNAGMIEHDGKITQGKWDPIVAEQEWRNVRALLEADTRRVTPGPKPQHLLSGLIICGGCGGRSFAVVSKNGRTAYQCRTPKGGDRAKGWCTSRDELAVDALVVAAITGLLAKPESAAALHPAVDVPALETERAAIRLRLNALAADTRLDDEQVGIRSVPLKARLDGIKAEIDSANQGSVVGDLAGQADAEARWFSLPLERQRAVAAALLTVTFLTHGPKGRRPNSAPRVEPSSVRIDWSELVAEVADQG
jgi:site-specific DNA recombinase